MNRATLYLILLAMGLMWGSTVPLTKIAVSTGHHPWGLIFWQFTISAVLLYGVARFRRSRFTINRQSVLFFTTVCLIGTLIPNSTSFWAAFHLPGGVMALIIAMVPMFALVTALVLRLENFQPWRLVGVALGGVAIALIVLPESSLPDPAKAIFVFIALIAPLCYGLEASYLALCTPSQTGPVATLFGASVIGILFSAPLVWWTGSFMNPLNGMGASEFALVGSSVLHVIAYTTYMTVVARAGPVFAGQVGYIVTPAGVILSILFLNESPSACLWLALLLLLIGVSMVQPQQAKSSSVEPVRPQ